MSPRTDVVAGENFLIPNGTFFAELAIFLIVLGVIWFFVVPPVRKVLAEREARVEETATTSKSANETFAEAKARYDTAMAAARAEAADIRKQAKAEGQAILEELRGEAQKEADHIVAESTAHLRAEADQVAAELREAVEPLAQHLADRMLGMPNRPRTSAGNQRGRGSS